MPAAINASISASSACCSYPAAPIGRCGDRNDEPGTPLQPDQPAGGDRSSGAAHRYRPWPPTNATPGRYRLEPRLAVAPEVPALDRVERAGPQILGLLGGQMFAHPRSTQRRCERLRRIDAEPVCLLYRGECRAAGLPLAGARRGSPAAPAMPDRISPRGCARGTHPAPRYRPGSRGKRPGPNIPALRRIRTQRPPPHMVGASFGRFRARGLRSADCSGSAAGVGSMRYRLRICRPPPLGTLTSQTYRRARHNVSLLHAHLVLVTKYRQRCSPTRYSPSARAPGVRTVRAELDVELVEFNGEIDHLHLLVHYPPTLAISALVQRLKGRTAYAVRREFTGRCVRARMRGHPWSRSYFAVSCGGAPLSIIKQYIDGQARPP